MKQRSKVLMLSIGLGLALSACSAGTPASKKDSVTVYDAHNRQILTTTSQAKIKRVTNLTSQSDRSTVNGQLPAGLRVKSPLLATPAGARR